VATISGNRLRRCGWCSGLLPGTYRKALAWLGHISSQMLDLYYHLHDEDSRQAMMALAEAGESREKEAAHCSPLEGNLRATG